MLVNFTVAFINIAQDACLYGILLTSSDLRPMHSFYRDRIQVPSEAHIFSPLCRASSPPPDPWTQQEPIQMNTKHAIATPPANAPNRSHERTECA